MIAKVFIDGKDTHADYGLLLASKSITAPEVKTNLVEVPGMDGALDLSDALTGEPAYKNRKISISLIGVKAVSGKEWPSAISDFCNAVHGKRLKISFPEDTAHYYAGRLSVGQISISGGKQSIAVEVDCDPWKYKNAATVVERADLGTEYQEISLPNERRPVIPTIKVGQETTLLWGETTIVLSAGTYRRANIRLSAGANTLKAKVAEGTGTIRVEYQEASL